MRFKQALSRKLAAALSAVMILSTIAPTSVPVLAAAPEDVLVDSSVEYDLQDAGSEDVLLDSAESSLAEETDALEVAGEVVTNNDELLDVANEAAETGSEPAEEAVVEPAEEAAVATKHVTLSNNSNYDITLSYSFLSENKTNSKNTVENVVLNAGDDVDIAVSSDQIKLYDTRSNDPADATILNIGGTRLDTVDEYAVALKALDQDNEVWINGQDKDKFTIVLVDKSMSGFGADGATIVSYNEVNASGSNVRKESTALYNSASYDGYVSGNTLKINSVTIQADMSTYVPVGVTYEPVNNPGHTVPLMAFGTKLDAPSDVVGQTYYVVCEQYVVSTFDTSKGTVSTDNIFNLKDAATGFATVSYNYLGYTGGTLFDGAAVWDSTDTWLFDESASKTVDFHVYLDYNDDTTTYTLTKAVAANKDCEVVDESARAYTIKVPTTVVAEYFKTRANTDAKLDVTLTQTKEASAQIVTVDRSAYGFMTSSPVEKVVLEVDDDQMPYTDNGTDREFDVQYGDKASLVIRPNPLYELKKVEIDKEIWKDGKKEAVPTVSVDKAEDLAKFKSGYEIEVGFGTYVTVQTEEKKTYTVKYASDSNDVDGENGKYNALYNKSPIWIEEFGAKADSSDVEHREIVSFNAVVGDKTYYNHDDDTIIKLDSEKIWLNNAKLSGNSITINFTDDSSDVTLSKNTVQHVTIDVDSESSKSVVFKDKKLSSVVLPLGTTKDYEIVITGNIKPEAIPKAPNKAGLDCEITTTKVNGKEVKVLRVISGINSTKGEESVIEIVDPIDHTKVFTSLTVKLETETVEKAKAPTVKVTGTTNNAIGISLTAPKGVDTKLAGLYYVVETKAEGQTSDILETSKVELVPATETSHVIKLLKAGKDPLEGDTNLVYTITVKLVQSKSNNVANYNSPANLIVEGTNSATVKNIKTKEGGVYETRLKLARSKASLPKLYTNMTTHANNGSAPYIIDVKYSKKTSIMKLTNVKLDKADGTAVENVNIEPLSETDVTSASGVLTINHNTIKITPSTDGDDGLDAGKYVLTATAYEPKGREVTATLKITVYQGMNRSLSVIPDAYRIAKQSGKKAQTKVTVITDELKKTKVKYEIVDANMTNAYLDPAGYKKSDIVKSGKITAKSGKILIDKACVLGGLDEDNQFRVWVQADDYKGNIVKEVSDIITVVNPANRSLKLYFDDGEGNYDKDHVVGGSKLVSRFFTCDDDDVRGKISVKDEGKYKYYAIIKATDKDTKTGAYDDSKYVPVKYSVAGAKLLKIVDDTAYPEKNVAIIGFTKPGTIKIKATPQDGSGRKTQTFTMTVTNSSGKLYYTLNGATKDGTADHTVSANDGTANNGINYSPAEYALTLDVWGADKDYPNKDKSFIATSVKVKGGSAKLIEDGKYSITVKDAKSVITITNTATKTNTVIPITNKAVKKAAAVTIAATDGANGKGKIYNYINFAAGYGKGTGKLGAPNEVTYTLTKNDGGATHVIVKVIKDDTRLLIPHDTINGVLGGQNYKVLPLTSKAFKIDYNTLAQPQGSFNIAKGSYKLSVTPVKADKAGDWEATAKAATVTVTASPAPKANIKFNTKVDFGNGGKDIKGKLEVKTAKNYIEASKIKVENDLRGVNTAGKINSFRDNFVLEGDVNTGFTIRFKGSAKIDKLDPKDKAQKNEFKGWIPYTYQMLNGEFTTDWVQVTISTKGTLTK